MFLLLLPCLGVGKVAVIGLQRWRCWCQPTNQPTNQMNTVNFTQKVWKMSKVIRVNGLCILSSWLNECQQEKRLIEIRLVVTRGLWQWFRSLFIFQKSIKLMWFGRASQINMFYSRWNEYLTINILNILNYLDLHIPYLIFRIPFTVLALESNYIHQRLGRSPYRSEQFGYQNRTPRCNCHVFHSPAINSWGQSLDRKTQKWNLKNLKELRPWISGNCPE